MTEQTVGRGAQLPVQGVVREVAIPAGVAGPDQVVMDVRCYAVAQPDGIVVVDTGMPDAEAGIAAAVEELGGGWGDVRDIVLTHLHMDHVGSLFSVAEHAPHAAIYAGGPDSPDIRAPRQVSAVGEGAEVQDLLVLATPGHTPGHISLFHEGTGTLFIGDAAGTSQGQVVRGPDAFTSDAARAEESLERLAALGAERILFAHGAEVDAPAEALSRMMGGPH